MNKLVESLLVYIPASILLILAGMFLGGEIWAKGRIVLGDILSFFGWLGKGVRKLSVESEYEGTINSIIQDFNKNFENPILPRCKITWVTADNQRNILNENEAIVCLSFDKKDHNLNFYNATLNFVQTGLIVKAKDYLTHSSRKAIDLLTTHIILRENRKEVLTTFRKKFNEFDEETKSEFESLAPTNERGLFLNLLLPEFHYYGELIDTLPPNAGFSTEANGFYSWFRVLATREIDERSNLKFVSKNFKVGVILVGKDETWDLYGASAYIKWADYYASEGYNSVYLLGKGFKGYERASEVAKVLVDKKGFDQINKNPKIKCYTAEGNEYIVTCYSLRPNRATIAYNAWQNLKEYYDLQKPVPAIIDTIQKEGLTVNVFGLVFELPNDLLSGIQVADARRIFKPEDELFLKIIEFNPDKQHVKLSNIGTSSDPKEYIEAVVNESKIYECIIERFSIDKQGTQSGLQVSTKELKSWVFIPKNKATTSRFLDLKTKFAVNQSIQVTIDHYSPTSSNFIGTLNNLIDPWKNGEARKIKNGSELTVQVKQINEFTVICEISEGLECRFSQYEISWNNEECKTSEFKVDDEVKVKVILIDEDKRLILVSIKQLIKTPELEYYELHQNQIVEAEIIFVNPEKGLTIKYNGIEHTGFIHWFEIGWGFVGKIDKLFNIGDKVYPLVCEYDSIKNRVRFSLKRKHIHQFSDWLKIIDRDAIIEGKIISYFENSTQIELNSNGIIVQAYLPNKEVSNVAFVEKHDLPYFLPLNQTFHFYIMDINEPKQFICLSRKEYLDSFENPEYGVSYQVSYTKNLPSKIIFYSDDLEGWCQPIKADIKLGDPIDVFIVSQANGEFQIA